MNLVATTFAMQPVCNAVRAVHALHPDQKLCQCWIFNSMLVPVPYYPTVLLHKSQHLHFVIIYTFYVIKHKSQGTYFIPKGISSAEI